MVLNLTLAENVCNVCPCFNSVSTPETKINGSRKVSMTFEPGNYQNLFLFFINVIRYMVVAQTGLS